MVGQDAPIIILTAYDWSDIEEEAKAAGVTAFCAKPLFMSDLKSALLAANNVGDAEQTDGDSVWTRTDYSGKRLLLVEDNELNREIASEILQQYGFEIEEAEDGAVAVETIKNARPGWYDLILMDIQMPVMDGYMATRTIRGLSDSSYADIPIIAMTANAFEDDKKNALESGMNGHIAKPVDVDALIRILADVLR